MANHLYMNYSFLPDYSISMIEPNESEAIIHDDIASTITDNQSLSSVEIKQIADKISDKLVKMVESQLSQPHQ
ncbi:hypothetical protein SAMN05660909_05675 [Chitinophaga terrae (ex Kim and Jung 2007)]|uniref:Uncharacterized protein n=1 Tax=Chitinophaga terrae (ex Kim and Jung 2007) TaxID=408074 RepID=A0A1H4GSE1_9BACT|nr:hypothetical protein [Chitinophaga terrae (ex Kim and Jung 2007)]GEP93718.1 hypothetical protein CTE07_53630 [Chitinophaga terrae (ex Kim and Jung 2007)]SEB12505.1 hypothetical protein SAMN05660909_05675 [Chitinophaga terrae (ex Kim and Jung 2007)]